MKLFQKIINEIITESPPNPMILLYLQNEPLLDKKLKKRIQFIKEKSNGRMCVGFLSNGSILTKDKIKILEETDIDFLSISLDATTDLTYNKVRGGFDFTQIVKNITNVLNSKIGKNHICVEFAVQKDNIHELKSFKKFWRKKVGGIVVNHITNRSGDLSNYDNISLDKEALTLLDRFKHMVLRKIFSYCPLPFTAFHILSNGDVILCTEDYNEKLKMGSLLDNSIKEIWNGKKYQELRGKIYNKRYLDIPLCKDCTRWRLGIF